MIDGFPTGVSANHQEYHVSIAIAVQHVGYDREVSADADSAWPDSREVWWTEDHRLDTHLLSSSASNARRAFHPHATGIARGM